MTSELELRLMTEERRGQCRDARDQVPDVVWHECSGSVRLALGDAAS